MLLPALNLILWSLSAVLWQKGSEVNDYHARGALSHSKICIAKIVPEGMTDKYDTMSEFM